MNHHGLQKLRCPRCRGALNLAAFAEETVDVDRDALDARVADIEMPQLTRVVRDGILVCESCSLWYPIASYVPVMLLFELPFHSEFQQRHRHEFDGWSRLGAPNDRPEPGERNVQQTFTEEWNAVRGSDLTFSYNKRDLQELHRQVWLKWDQEPPADVQQILNVGCGGQAGEAEALYSISRAEVFGIDLTPTLLHAAKSLRHQPLLHVAVASLFHLPFEERSFDLVYSQGVLHHTYSTQAAFRSCSRFVRPGGQICIWVYGLEDHLAGKGLRGWIERLKYYAEEYLGIRWLVSHLPAWLRGVVVRIVALAAHPFFKARKRHSSDWTLANTEHSVRDRITPRFAHKHSFNEVLEWFEELGFTIEVHSPTAYRNLFGRSLWGVGVKGTRMR